MDYTRPWSICLRENEEVMPKNQVSVRCEYNPKPTVFLRYCQLSAQEWEEYCYSIRAGPCNKRRQFSIYQSIASGDWFAGAISQRLRPGLRWPRCNSCICALSWRSSRAWDLPERLRDVLVEYEQNDWCGSSRTVNDPCAQQCSEFFRGDGSAHCAWLGRSWPCSRCPWLCAVPYLQCGQCDKRGTCRGLSKLCRSA